MQHKIEELLLISNSVLCKIHRIILQTAAMEVVKTCVMTSIQRVLPVELQVFLLLVIIPSRVYQTAAMSWSCIMLPGCVSAHKFTRFIQLSNFKSLLQSIIAYRDISILVQRIARCHDRILSRMQKCSKLMCLFILLSTLFLSPKCTAISLSHRHGTSLLLRIS